jgi:hypothetical protein
MLFAEPKRQNTYSKGTRRRMRGETTAGDKGTCSSCKIAWSGRCA